ncbi:MAG: hypothetical protein BWY45_02556 [Euryarchaeota archaeon ADurb.Bin294]|nr:MAG: hypothetical protein BWY45_02556 [Euryarchaeota archaeon ADurb.Bin294]
MIIIKELSADEKRQYITWRKKFSCIISYLLGKPVVANCVVNGKITLRALTKDHKRQFRYAYPLKTRIENKLHGIIKILSGEPLIANWWISGPDEQ